VKGPSPQRLWKYLARCLRRQSYLESPSDGRKAPQIPARVLLRALLLGRLLREYSFHAVEALVHSSARRALQITIAFGDDVRGYFTARLPSAPTRAALATALRQAKRHKAFDDNPFIGVAVEVTPAGRCQPSTGKLCRPHRNAVGQVTRYRHHGTLVSMVGTGLTLPFEVEP
jgi:hypothetical protein